MSFKYLYPICSVSFISLVSYAQAIEVEKTNSTKIAKKDHYKEIPHFENYDQNAESATDGKLEQEFEQCSKGMKQSPVDIIAKDIQNNKLLPKIVTKYKKSPLNIWNNQHTIKVKFEKGSQLILGKEKYELLQFHFHTPSEHKLNGKDAEMEIHFVHQDKAGNYAVLAVLMHAGNENKALKSLFDNLPKEDHTNHNVKGVFIDPKDILPKNLNYYSYFGSLTTPPCDEKVHWYLLKSPIEVSPAQIQKFKDIYSHNSRSINPLNGRIVEKRIEEE